MVVALIAVLFLVLIFGPCILASQVNLDREQPQQAAAGKPIEGS
jgi:hypothetical protein